MLIRDPLTAGAGTAGLSSCDQTVCGERRTPASKTSAMQTELKLRVIMG
jgi:hypothetical protein